MLTPQAFFDRLREHGLGSVPEALGTCGFELEGPGGGHWVVDFTRGTVTAGPQPASRVVRAATLDFIALVEGRMSVSDGILTQRLHLTGEATGFHPLAQTLHQLRERMP